MTPDDMVLAGNQFFTKAEGSPTIRSPGQFPNARVPLHLGYTKTSPHGATPLKVVSKLQNCLSETQSLVLG